VSQALVVLRSLAGLSCCIGVYCMAYAMGAAPTGEPARLGLRGLKRQRAVAENGAFAQIEPVMRWVGRRVRGLISEERAAALDKDITLAGDFLGLVPEEIIGLTVMTTVVGTLMGYLLGQAGNVIELATLGGFVFGVIYPTLTVSGERTERMVTISRRLPQVIDILALAVGAGLDFPGAIRQVVEKAGSASDPLVEEFSLVLQSLQLGRTRRDALEEFARRAGCRAVIDFTGAVIQAELRGTPIASVLMIQADVSRQQRSTNAEVAAAKANVKFIMPLALIFVCVLILIGAPMMLSLRSGLS
jgi:tight adherence protein C